MRVPPLKIISGKNGRGLGGPFSYSRKVPVFVGPIIFLYLEGAHKTPKLLLYSEILVYVLVIDRSRHSEQAMVSCHHLWERSNLGPPMVQVLILFNPARTRGSLSDYRIISNLGLPTVQVLILFNPA